jgi:serine/threonine protein kinase
MASDTLTLSAFLSALERFSLLDHDRLKEVTQRLATQFPAVVALADELTRRGWLTAYQVRQILDRDCQDLVLGKYVLLDSLGQGGMGQVFKARQPALERLVALKVIRKDRLGSPEAAQRFQREARALARIRHANVVALHDLDESGGRYFLVMEYIPGTDLRALVNQRGPLPISLACDFLRQAAHGLQHAHEQGLVHRDVKPSNLLCTNAGSAGSGRETDSAAVIKVLDLGLARLLPVESQCSSSTEEITADSQFLGTPDYMAPEQAHDSHRVDGRADVYSLGCTFYFLLTAQAPFAGGSALEKLYKHKHAQPIPPSSLRRDAGPDLEAILDRMMAKRPDDRYQTPAEVAAALAPFCRPAATDNSTLLAQGRPRPAEASPTRAPDDRIPSTVCPVPPRPPRRWFPWLLGSALLSVGVLAGLVWLLRPKPDPDGPKRNPDTPKLNGTQQQHQRKRKPSALNRLDPDLIPLAMRPRIQPKELVGVLGTIGQAPSWESVEFRGSLSVADDDSRVLFGGPVLGGSVRLWEVATGAEISRRLTASRIYSVAFVADGEQFLAADGDGGFSLCATATGEVVRRFRGHTQGVLALAGSPHGKRVLSGSRDGTVRLWDLDSGKERRRLVVSPGWLLDNRVEVNSVAFAPDGKLLAAAVGDSSILLGAVEEGAAVRFLKHHRESVTGVAFAPGGGYLASCGQDGRCVLWDLATEKPRDLHLPPLQTIPRALAFSPDGKHLAAVTDNGRVLLWRALGQTGVGWDRPDHLSGWQLIGPLCALTFSSDGRHLLAAHLGGIVYVLRLKSD